jgi:N,N-dimethylformamidase
MTYDSNQRFLSFVPGGNGVLYAIQADGALLWYQHTGWANGTQVWSPGSSLVIGSGWHQFTTVLANSDGQIYALRPDGTLLWYRYILSNSTTGAGSWAAGSGSVIGNGFNRFARIFGGWGGVVYGLDAAGDMYWYRYAAGNGTNAWGANTGALIGSGWNEYPWLMADPDGVIYGVQQGGNLNWWRYNVPNVNTGIGAWANGGSAITIGNGWGDVGQKVAWSNTSGAIYAVVLDTAQVPKTDNLLTWFRLQNSETVDSSGVAWYNGANAVTVGNGFTQQASAALQGYPSALSTPQGGSVGIQVSTTWPTYTASVLRLAPAGASGAPVTVVPQTSHTGTFKQLPSGYRSSGCGWATDFTVPTTSSWLSGIYSAQLLSSYGNEHDVVFIVRPSTPTNKIAVVVPTNTYHAYNTWGGHDQYTAGQATGQRTVSLLRPSVTTLINPTGYINHTLYSDLLLYSWMTANNIAFDVYTDADVDANTGNWMSSYKGIVLGSHPEYWTQTARQNVINYLAAGGRVIATGGNSLYEEVSYTSNGSAVVFRTTSGDRNLFEDLGLFESDVIGLEYNAATYMDFYPYQVQTDHAFLNGTGLTVGGTFGASGYNVAASGWEVDWAVEGITGQIVIAQGTNPNGGGSMCYVPMANNGWVFTTGSISFNGSISGDPDIQRILTNVFAAAVL